MHVIYLMIVALVTLQQLTCVRCNVASLADHSESKKEGDEELHFQQQIGGSEF